jgi:hypothetical protein
LLNVVEYTTDPEKIEDSDNWNRAGSRPLRRAPSRWGAGGVIAATMISAMFNAAGTGRWSSSPI